jgi:hypothetical protein
MARFSPHPVRHGIGNASCMPTTTDAELSLINNAELLEQLGQVRAADRFGGLDSGLPMHTEAPPFGAPLHDREPVGDDDEDAPAERTARANEDIPFVAAALVIAACLTAGATTAAFVFHDRLVQITATSASR